MIQNTLNKCLTQLTTTEKLLPIVLTKAAKRRNLTLPDHELNLLVNAIMNAKEDLISLDLNAPCVLGETEDEIRTTVQNLINESYEVMPEVEQYLTEICEKVIPTVLIDVASLIGEDISKNALTHTIDLQRAHTARAELVQHLWGNAITHLDFLRHIVLEWNGTAVELRKGPYSNQNTALALNKLTSRAYEVVGELTVLVTAGYADGALARWRSLHEVCVTAMFLAKQSDRCAQMYLLHHLVEELRLLETDKCGETLKKRDSERNFYVRNLRKKIKSLKARYGPIFAKDYGWASIELCRGKTTFRDLEQHVGLEKLRRGYKRANSIVHGGALATLTRISLGGGADSNHAPPAFGCEVALDYAAASLSMMIAHLCMETEDADLLTMSMVVHNYAHKIRENIEQATDGGSGTTPRAKVLQRKAQQRRIRVRQRRISYPNRRM